MEPSHLRAEASKQASAWSDGVTRDNSKQHPRSRPQPSGTTPDEVLRELFVDGADYDQQELEDLGWVDAEPPFTRDTTAEIFHAQELEFRNTQRERHLSWWDSEETRWRAWWKIRQRYASSADIRGWDALLKRLGFRVGDRSSDHVSLSWLTSATQGKLEEWRALREAHRKLLSKLSTWLDSQADEIPTDLPAGCSVSEVLNYRLENLKERQQLVLKARFGLGGMAPHTLEETAVLDGAATGRTTSRERIRQIERKALNRLAHHLPMEFAEALLRPAAERLARSPVSMPRGEALPFVRNGLQPLERLLVRASNLDLARWFLPLVGRVHGDRFLVGELGEDQAVSLAEELDESNSAAEVLLPTPLERFRREIDVLSGRSVELVRSALVASCRYGLEAEFVISASRPRAELDAIELWQRMAHVSGYVSNRFLGTRATKASTTHRIPDFLRRDRNACLDFPHLFMKVGDDAFLALTLKEEMLSPRRPADATDPHPWSPAPGTVNHLMSQTLRALGVARFTEWRNESVRASGGQLPHGSVQALTTIRTDLFLRIAPGTYATPDTDLGEHQEKLVNAHQIQMYLDGRAAGEAADSYPAWNPALEQAWCKWARAHEPLRYQELLHFCAIEAWDCTDADLAWWLDEKSRLARDPRTSGLPAPAGSPTELCPNEMLEMLCMIALDGGINQQRVNRSLGMRPEIGTTWAYLSVLVAAGFVEEGDSWHAWHAAKAMSAENPDLGAIRRDLLEERSRTGSVAGTSAAFRRLRHRAVIGLEEDRCSWLAGFSRTTLLDVLADGLDAPSPAPRAVPRESGSDLDQLLHEALLDEYADALGDELSETD